MTPSDTYKEYLAFKNHFTREKYDYHKYGGRSKAKIESFYKRKDRYFFEKTSRKYKDNEIHNFFLANFVATDNPSAIWVGEIMQSGERKYSELSKKYQSLTYTFTEECRDLFEETGLNEAFDCSKGHPVVVKKYLAGDLSAETITILDKKFKFSAKIDKKISDPVWETVSMKIRKYKPFLNTDILKCKQILRGIIDV